MNEDGSKAAIHGEDIDIVVTGSLPSETLRMVAESLGIPGHMVPKGWVESSTTTIGEAASATEFPAGAIGSARGLARHRSGSMGTPWCSDMPEPVIAVFGSLVAPGASLVPPLEADVIGVEVPRPLRPFHTKPW